MITTKPPAEGVLILPVAGAEFVDMYVMCICMCAYIQYECIHHMHVNVHRELDHMAQGQNMLLLYCRSRVMQVPCIPCSMCVFVQYACSCMHAYVCVHTYMGRELNSMAGTCMVPT